MKRILQKILNDSALIKLLPAHVQELSILITSDERMASWNESYRGKRGPTDVLSFSQQEESPTSLPLHRQPSPSLGDLVVSLPTAKKQALRFGVTLEMELLRLLIHGTLHLLGFDHEKVSAVVATRMRRREERLMQVLRADARVLIRAR